MIKSIQELLDTHWDSDLKGEKLDPKDVHEVGNWIVVFTDFSIKHISFGVSSIGFPKNWFTIVAIAKSARTTAYPSIYIV